MTEDNNIPASEEPIQSGEYPTWEYPARVKEGTWGEVTKVGLVVGRGKTKKVVPPDEVFKLASYGCNAKEIATWFGITLPTLLYNFGEYIEQGKEHVKQRLRAAQIETALKGNPAMLIWLGKNMLGQSDNPLDNQNTDPLPWSDDDVPTEESAQPPLAGEDE